MCATFVAFIDYLKVIGQIWSEGTGGRRGGRRLGLLFLITRSRRTSGTISSASSPATGLFLRSRIRRHCKNPRLPLEGPLLGEISSA